MLELENDIGSIEELLVNMDMVPQEIRGLFLQIRMRKSCPNLLTSLFQSLLFYKNGSMILHQHYFLNERTSSYR